MQQLEFRNKCLVSSKSRWNGTEHRCQLACLPYLQQLWVVKTMNAFHKTVKNGNKESI